MSVLATSKLGSIYDIKEHLHGHKINNDCNFSLQLATKMVRALAKVASASCWAHHVLMAPPLTPSVPAAPPAPAVSNVSTAI